MRFSVTGSEVCFSDFSDGFEASGLGFEGCLGSLIFTSSGHSASISPANFSKS
ncbi:MAG: hypothetical protein II869_05245 [Synergistaceae bacterium]|nr:hypothetical protein [Synergistaceae bacterium]